MGAPTELLVFRFDRGGRFEGQMIGALERLEGEAMSVRDVLFVHRDDAGTDRGITPEAIAELAEPLAADEAAMLLLVEHTWREVLDRAVTAAGGFAVR